MSLASLEQEARRALLHYLASGWTLDIAGLVGMVAEQFTPNQPSALARLAVTDPYLLTCRPDVRFLADDGPTPYSLLRANTYERIALQLREECLQHRYMDPVTA